MGIILMNQYILRIYKNLWVNKEIYHIEKRNLIREVNPYKEWSP